MRDAGDFFPARGVSVKPRDIEGYFFALIVILKATPAGRPARRYTFVRQQKYTKMPSPSGGL